MNSVVKLWFFLQIVHEGFGDIELTCNTVNTLAPVSVTCTCKYSGNGVSWLYPNGTKLVNCFPSVQCLPTTNGFIFSIDVSASLYKMTVINYRYSDCVTFTCKDISNSAVMASARPSPLKFDSTTPIILSEPTSSYSNGIISITTACIFEYSKLKYNWFIVKDGSETEYMIEQGRSIFDANNSSCNQCDGDSLRSLTIGFIHTEGNGSGSQTVSFKIQIYHEDYPLEVKSLLTSHAYTIQQQKEKVTCITPECSECTTTLTLIGVAFGTFVFTIVAVVLTFMGYRYIRSKQNLGTSAVQPTEGLNESQTISADGNYNRSSNYDTSSYEQLNESGEEGNTYTELQSIPRMT